MNANALAIVSGHEAATSSRFESYRDRYIRLRQVLSVPLPKCPPPVVGNNDSEGHDVSCNISRRDLQLRDRLAEAVRRRLYPHSALRVKQLAHDTGLSERTIWNVLGGNSDPSARTLARLGDFFSVAFKAEVFDVAGIVDLKGRRVAAIMRQQEALNEELVALLGTGTSE